MEKMLNLIRSLSLVLFLSACGALNVINYPVVVDTEFMPYIERYKDDKFHFTQNSTNRISITFRSSPDNSYVGVCFIGYGTRWLEIDPEYWFNVTDTDRYILILHEMGHCDLNLDHSTDHSIMNEYLLSDWQYDNNPEFYLKKLFLEGK